MSLSHLADLAHDAIYRLAADLDAATDSPQDQRTVLDSRNEATGAMARLIAAAPVGSRIRDKAMGWGVIVGTGGADAVARVRRELADLRDALDAME